VTVFSSCSFVVAGCKSLCLFLHPIVTPKFDCDRPSSSSLYFTCHISLSSIIKRKKTLSSPPFRLWWIERTGISHVLPLGSDTLSGALCAAKRWQPWNGDSTSTFATLIKNRLVGQTNFPNSIKWTSSTCFSPATELGLFRHSALLSCHPRSGETRRDEARRRVWFSNAPFLEGGIAKRGKEKKKLK
jgi:hypothetical protein